MPTKTLPPSPSLDHLKHQAVDLLKEYKQGKPEALERIRRSHPRFAHVQQKPSGATKVSLADAQFVIAREYGFASWARLKRQIHLGPPSERLEKYTELAEDLVAACGGNVQSFERVNLCFARTGSVERMRELIHKFLIAVFGSGLNERKFSLSDAQLFIARRHGVEGWEQFVESIEQGPNSSCSTAAEISTSPPFYRIDWKRRSVEPIMIMSIKDWEYLFDVIKEHRLTELNANGRMTDAAMEQLGRIDCITSLNLGGSKQLSDEGLKHLKRMPQLRDLDLSDYPGGRITDRGLEVLRELAELRVFKMCWQSAISDKGIANLRSCARLEKVDLLGTPTGDGAIAALAGKSDLRFFKTGRLVTDAGLLLLHDFPRFKKWCGGERRYGLMSFDAEPTDLLIDGSFTNKGLSGLAGLNGLFGLSFFWHTSVMTSEGLKVLPNLANIGFLGCQGALCDDEAMKHIATIPRLRMLMAQGTIASNEGFEFLSTSKTIEYVWGRECPNLSGRGFAALAEMPALKELAVSCKLVDQKGLSTLPRFPALREFLPMDIPDEGFRHVGLCKNLEALICMYCRNTGDTATQYLKGLQHLKKYYAGATQITDRSLGLLGTMHSLEHLEFDQCLHLTNSGLTAIAKLPKLKEVSIAGSPKVTREGMSVFGPSVSVSYQP